MKLIHFLKDRLWSAKPTIRNILLIWLAWAVIISAYQVYVRYRFDVKRPDSAVYWTSFMTVMSTPANESYLSEPFLNDHVSWDSEYYLSIAVDGYNDPQMRALPGNYSPGRPQLERISEQPTWTSMNYAFFPLYPYITRIFSIPLRLLEMTPIARATLAGVIVSMLGTLAAMLALYDLGKGYFGEPAGMRAAFYVLIFPASMFLAQVYTEGLFLGLSFGSLALMRRRKWLPAALLAGLSVFTRAAGGFLLIPLIIYWLQDGGFERLIENFSLKEGGKVLCVITPVLAYFLWAALFGKPFWFIEKAYFNRDILLWTESVEAWSDAWEWMRFGGPAGRAYYLVEFTAIALGILACLWIYRRDKALAIYGLAVILFSMTTGVAQGMHRYVMAAPALFLLPARLGQNEAFDRAWTLANILIMGVFAAMFSFDFWAG